MKTTNLIQSGVIHTLELHIRKRDGINLEQTFVDKKHPKRIARSFWDSDKKGLSVQINPNKEGSISPETGSWRTYGDCPSTTQLEAILQKWATHKGLKRDDLQIRRTDFAIDCKNEENAAQFKKLADMLITALVVKHDVNRKNQFFVVTFLHAKPRVYLQKQFHHLMNLFVMINEPNHQEMIPSGDWNCVTKQICAVKAVVLQTAFLLC